MNRNYAKVMVKSVIAVVSAFKCRNATNARTAILCAAGVMALCCTAASASVEVLDASYRPDRVLPEFTIFWKDSFRWGDDVTSSIYKPSGAVAVYVRNTGTSSVTISDLLINGASLAGGFGCSTDTFKGARACSVRYPSVNTTLVNAGEPAWWRIDPGTLAPGETAELFVRMRKRVATTLSLTVRTSAGDVPASVVVNDDPHPKFAGYGLSPDSTKLYLYLRHPQKGKLPAQILIDGVDLTANCAMGGDDAYDLTPVRCNLPSALPRGSFHCFQAIYDDGTRAADGLRVYYDDFKYGRWGGPKSDDNSDALFHIRDMGVHSMNLQVQGWGGMANYTGTPEFNAIKAQYDIEQAGGAGDYGPFLCDEPDATESLNAKIPQYCPSQVGALAQDFSDQSRDSHVGALDRPTTLNLDASFKPSNYYIYAQVPDVISLDPYYQTRILDAYWYRPNSIPLYSKATYIYALSSTCGAAKEPGKLHVVINSCRKHEGGNRIFRWATPEEKRIEVFYCLAAGAKQISYWWFSLVGINSTGFCGISDADEPGSAALWREMGLLGAEIGIASPLLENSCPVSVDITKPGKLWTRALLSGTNSVVLLCVNDDYTCDDTGTIIRQLKGVDVGIKIPSWINPTNVFEVDYRGVRDVAYDVAGSNVNVHLGRVGVTRMVVITSDPTVKAQLQARYSSTYGPRVSQLISH